MIATFVKNTSGQSRRFEYLPPNGQTLLVDQEVYVPGILDTILFLGNTALINSFLEDIASGAIQLYYTGIIENVPLHSIGEDLLNNAFLLTTVRTDGRNAFYANQSMGGARLTNVGYAVNDGDGASKLYVDTQDAARISRFGDAMSGYLDVLDPVDDQNAANKRYVDQTIAWQLMFTIARHTEDDKNMIPHDTFGDNSNTGLPITHHPYYDGYTQVFVNGVKRKLGDGVVSEDCYFMDPSLTFIRRIREIAAGDILFWNGTISGMNLTSADRVDFDYEVLAFEPSSSSVPSSSSSVPELPPVYGEALPGQIAFFLSRNTIGGDPDLFWDEANRFFGLGTSVPYYGLDIDKEVRIRDGTKLWFGGSSFGDAEVNLYRSAPSVLATDDNFSCGGLWAGSSGVSTTGAIQSYLANGYLSSAGTPGKTANPMIDGVTLEFEDGLFVGSGSSSVPAPTVDLLNVGEVREIVTDLGVVSGNQTLDLSLGNVFAATASGEVTWAFSTLAPSGRNRSFTLILTNGAIDDQIFPPTVKWAGSTPPTLTAGIDVLAFTSLDGGATWIGVLAGADFDTIAGNFLFRWGRNNTGTLGDGTHDDRSSPVQIGSSGSWKAANGFSVSLALRSDGRLYSCGGSAEGALGQGPLLIVSSPVQVGSDRDWAVIAGGYGNAFSLGIRAGKLFVWGDGYYGQLGDGSNGATAMRSSPVQLGSETDWDSLATGQAFCLGIRGGRLFAWGQNAYGQLGLGDNNSRSSPVQVGAETDWVSVAGGGAGHVMSIRGGKLYAWGYNPQGQLGDGTDVSKNSPIQIGGETDWVEVSCGGYWTLARRADGTIYSWGSGQLYGELGIGLREFRSSPVQIGAETDWLKIAAYGEAGAGIRGSGGKGKLYTWGENDHGQLGLGDSHDRSSPVQVGSDADWLSIMVSGGFCAFKERP